MATSDRKAHAAFGALGVAGLDPERETKRWTKWQEAIAQACGK